MFVHVLPAHMKNSSMCHGWDPPVRKLSHTLGVPVLPTIPTDMNWESTTKGNNAWKSCWRNNWGAIMKSAKQDSVCLWNHLEQYTQAHEASRSSSSETDLRERNYPTNVCVWRPSNSLRRIQTLSKSPPLYLTTNKEEMADALRWNT